MPGIYIGTSPLKCAYLGTTAVKCIYVGTTKVRPNTRKGIDLFLVGGGGAGGAGYYRTLAGYGYRLIGGGGGAGGVRCQTGLELQTGSYCVKVGAGGVKDTFTSTTTGGGCPSQFCGNGVNYAVCGGGYGGGAVCGTGNTSPTYQGKGGNGGSGGGGVGGCYYGAGGSHSGCGCGNTGGTGATGGYGAGGGGSGFKGGNSGVLCSRAGGYGGCGCCTNFFGAAKCIAGGGNGGGCYCRNCKLVSDSSSVSNTYGGGYGAAFGGCGGDATCYGGGGGGGSCGGNYGPYKGGHGYQGIVGIRYPSSCGYNITGGCKYACTISGVSYCIHCFTSDGTLTIN